MPSTGVNKVEDRFRSRGTYRLTPLSGVTDKGGRVTVTAAAGVVTLAVTAAGVLLDSLEYALPAGSLVTGVLPNGTSQLEVYVNPIRKVLAVATLPATAVVGTEVMLVGPADENTQYLQDIYTFTAAGWVRRDAYIKGNLDPNKAYQPEIFYAPGSSDFRNLPFNAATGAVLALKDELSILYTPTAGIPAFLSAMGPAYARYAGGVLIAKVSVKLTAGAIANATTDVKITRPKSVDL